MHEHDSDDLSDAPWKEAKRRTSGAVGDKTEAFKSGGNRSDDEPLVPPVETLTAAHWISRQIAESDRLLGAWLTTDNRALIAAKTGLGKTNFAMAAAFAMASGQPFLHWRCPRKARVLYIDGEMSRRLMRERIKDAVRRCGGDVPKSIYILCRDDIDDMPPLNHEHGQMFVESVITAIEATLGKLDFIFFDNVQSLLTGDMKEEESWAQTLPWIKSLTRRHIGQCWIHHTGIDETRQYGTNTRLWQLDTVIVLEENERPKADIAFTLKFTKARERTPKNCADFDPVVVTLLQDRWEFKRTIITTPPKPPSPKGSSFHSALLDALAACGKPRQESANRPSVTFGEWQSEAIRLGLMDSSKKGNNQRATISKYRLELVAAKWVACNGELAWNTKVTP